jgi:hypothetical protein
MKTKISDNILLILLILFIYLFSAIITSNEIAENINDAIIRIKKSWKFPFVSKKIYVVTDVNKITDDKTTFIFLYTFNKAVQFINGKFSMIHNIEDIELY